MSLGLDDVYRIAELAHVGINEEAAQRMQAELNDIFKMIERIQAVDTEGVEPMKNAPEEFEGLFLVPQVIE